MSRDNIADNISMNNHENEPPEGMVANRSSSGERVNPFESDVIAGLQKSFWSPSIMDIKETPPQRSWAIEHLSHLFPKDIENSPTSHQNAFPLDEQAEMKAQADINKYFSRTEIVPTPSPMKERAKLLQYTEVTRINKANAYVCGQSPIARGSGTGAVGHTNGLILKKKKVKSAMESWTQTALSLPPELPPHVEEVLSQYFVQEDDMCGSSCAVSSFSQKSEASDSNDNGEYDSGKNSSSLNNSIRRRLELSFGDEPEGEDSNSVSGDFSIGDPFRRNHVVSTPPNPAYSDMNTTTSDLESQFRRCEFTPEARGKMHTATPILTPICDDEPRFDNATNSTPKRTNSSFSFKRWTVKDVPPVSPVPGCSNANEIFKADHCKFEESDSKINTLRRSRTDSTNKKVSSALSFDDHYLMDISSPPTKLYRRNSENTS